MMVRVRQIYLGVPSFCERKRGVCGHNGGRDVKSAHHTGDVSVSAVIRGAFGRGGTNGET